MGNRIRLVRIHRCESAPVLNDAFRTCGEVMFNAQAVARIAVLSALGVHGACSIFPTSGPASSDVRNAKSDPEGLPYALVRVTPQVEKVLEQKAPRIAQVFPDRGGPGEIRFGIGDVVSVTVFEAAAGGLFIPLEAGVRPGNFITLPNQAVDNSGNITVPYAGAIRAKGRTVVEIQKAIVDALQNRALEPQAVVAVVDQRASSVSVLGDVGTPSRFPANANGERLLDVIARAGGPKNPGYDTWVMLERQGRQASAPFAALVNQPSNNVWVRAQDTIYVFTEPRTFTVFGASGLQGHIPFAAWRLTLAEAIAKAGGLNDSLADPASVFLYRGEPREVAELLGVDCSRFSGPVIPIIFNLNLRDPAGYFLASNFEMRNKDVIFTSNAVAVEATKFLTYVRLLVATVNDPLLAAVNAYTLKNIAQGATATAIVSTPAPIVSGH
jgi:polysaccharide biosynthesis/export protein